MNTDARQSAWRKCATTEGGSLREVNVRQLYLLAWGITRLARASCSSGRSLCRSAS
jgi:hypothetical protein